MKQSNYWDYLALPSLLNLQGGLEGEERALMPDELHFIVVHQVFELWFKLILRELRLGRDHLAASRVPEAEIPHVVHHLRRVNTILELAVDQFRVMETLTPQDFLAFRDKLVPASGFQSYQMREMEILLGLGADQREATPFGDPLQAIRQLAKHSEGGVAALAALERATAERSLKDALDAWLFRTPIQGSTPDRPEDDEVVTQFIAEYAAAGDHLRVEQRARFVSAGILDAQGADAKFQEAAARAASFLAADDVAEADRKRTRRVRAAMLFIESYRDLPLLAWPRLLTDTIVELEELLILWRTRHVRMVERVIGRRIGTGGSAGVDYLERTTRHRIFADLWTIRTVLLPRDRVPALQGAAQYGFAGGTERDPIGATTV